MRNKVSGTTTLNRSRIRAQHGGDDRGGDLGFDQIRAAVPAGVNDDLGVAEVGDGVQRQVLERPPPGHRSQSHQPMGRGELPSRLGLNPDQFDLKDQRGARPDRTKATLAVSQIRRDKKLPL